ncbi:MAG: hypothetical protein JWO09_1823 [Bacteroidetes bacterium]|nr:hypothetical protein [Bacteroidota bacterium]
MLKILTCYRRAVRYTACAGIFAFCSLGLHSREEFKGKDSLQQSRAQLYVNTSVGSAYENLPPEEWRNSGRVNAVPFEIKFYPTRHWGLAYVRSNQEKGITSPFISTRKPLQMGSFEAVFLSYNLNLSVFDFKHLSLDFQTGIGYDLRGGIASFVSTGLSLKLNPYLAVNLQAGLRHSQKWNGNYFASCVEAGLRYALYDSYGGKKDSGAVKKGFFADLGFHYSTVASLPYLLVVPDRPHEYYWQSNIDFVSNDLKIVQPDYASPRLGYHSGHHSFFVEGKHLSTGVYSWGGYHETGAFMNFASVTDAAGLGYNYTSKFRKREKDRLMFFAGLKGMLQRRKNEYYYESHSYAAGRRYIKSERVDWNSSTLNIMPEAGLQLACSRRVYLKAGAAFNGIAFTKGNYDVEFIEFGSPVAPDYYEAGSFSYHAVLWPGRNKDFTLVDNVFLSVGYLF